LSDNGEVDVKKVVILAILFVGIVLGGFLIVTSQRNNDLRTYTFKMCNNVAMYLLYEEANLSKLLADHNDSIASFGDGYYKLKIPMKVACEGVENCPIDSSAAAYELRECLIKRGYLLNRIVDNSYEIFLRTLQNIEANKTKEKDEQIKDKK